MGNETNETIVIRRLRCHRTVYFAAPRGNTLGGFAEI